MDVKSLKSFVAVATLKSFSAAARELHTVQPAISRHIAALEEELGTSLFIRNTRDVQITAAGLQLLSDGKALLKQFDDAKSRTQKAAKGELGHLRIGYLPSACLTLIPYLVKRFHAEFPHVDISLYEMTVAEQLIAFKNDDIDVGVSRPLPADNMAGLNSASLYRDHLCVVVPQEHAMAEQGEIKLSDLQEENIILFHREEAVGLFDTIIHLCQANGFSPNLSAQPKHMQTLLTMVASGLGVAIAPYCVAKLYTKGCCFIRIERDDTDIWTHIHYQEKGLTPTANAFVELAKASADVIQEQMKVLSFDA
ncbi:LysR substrate-binding domain-containing protein [Marinomonas sp. 5E14-1]|uniref:LysR family transcriptional regulator n=1 Tax=Marinomonas sp. 5E14-1 TaxID=3153922 RepID=UPI003266B361